MVHVEVETASSYLDPRESREKVAAPTIDRTWSFYRRWVGREPGEKESAWWNPLEEEEAQRDRLARQQEDRNLSHKPSRITRLQSLRWPSTAAKRMSDIEEASNERHSTASGSFSHDVGRTPRLPVVIPGSVGPPCDDVDDLGLGGSIPTMLSPSIPIGPNAVPARLYAEAAQVDSSPPQSITPSFRSYLEAIQRSILSASFGATSFATIPEADSAPPAQVPFPTTFQPDSAVLAPEGPTRPQRPVSSSTFGPIPHGTDLPRFHPNHEHSHPSTHRPHATPPSATMRLPAISPEVSPAQSFGSSFARYVGAIQRSLSRSSTGLVPSNRPSRASTRATAVSRTATHRTFGSSSRSRTTSNLDEEDESASLVPPLPTSSTFDVRGGNGGGMIRDWDDDETTMESFEGQTTVDSESAEDVGDLGEVVDVVQTGSAARAAAIVVGGGGRHHFREQSSSTGSTSWAATTRPLPVPFGSEARMIGRQEEESWVKVVRKLPEVPLPG